MEQITIENLTFSYDVSSGFSLSNVSLQVEEGEILLITGASGCGKTTLLRHLKREYMPQGNRNEDSIIRICGKNLFELNDREQARLVGFVGQDVEAMQVTDKVWHELSFGLENLGYSQDVMERRIAEMTAFFGLEGIYHEKLCDLSGGQKQLVNLAAVMVMEPEVLVLDEPTSQLDPVAATELFRMLWKINKELGTTIVITEHCLEEIFHLCDRVCVMDKGRVEIVDVPQRVARYLYEKKHRLAGALPAAAKLYFACGDREKEIPLTVNEGRKWFRNCVEKKDRYLTEVNFEQNETMSYAIIADELWYRYEKDGKDILKACNFKVQQGKITAILGGNGTGKSTLLHVLAGHFTPYSGKVKYLVDSKKGNQSIGMLPQNPQAMFAKKTVEEELHVSCGVGGNKKMDKEVNPKLQTVIDFCDLGELLHQHPFDLSGGQMQKLALAKLLLEDKEILLLDEPGKGMDYEFKEEMGGLLRSLAQQGKTIVMVSHDIEFCARYADMCGLFFDGHVVSFSQSRSFFLQNTFYTTAITRICRGILPQAVALEDALHAFGAFDCNVVDASSNEPIKGSGVSDREKVIIHKEEDKKNGIISNADKVIESRLDTKEVVAKNEKRAHGKTAILTFVIVFLVMPFTIYIGHTVLLQRKYYFISLLLILEAIACFFLRFEKRKPKMREIMIVSMMSAIVVAARAAFYMIPSVKPMAALIIITGIGLGAEAGFLVGAMSMLVSNIFFGQGPWTPWQMFTMGMLGFLAGAIFRKGTVETTKKKFAVCVFGLLSVILVYGGIMNPASVLMYQENVNMPMLLSACVMGLPYDAIHGVATFIFLWIGTRPMLNKLQRVKDKSQFLL